MEGGWVKYLGGVTEGLFIVQYIQINMDRYLPVPFALILNK